MQANIKFKQLYDKYDYFIFDCDGVLFNSDTPIPNSDKVLRLLLSDPQKKVFFFSNNSCYTREHLIRKVQVLLGDKSMQDPIFSLTKRHAYVPDHIIPQALVQTLNPQKIVLFGEDSLKQELIRVGIGEIIYNPMEGVKQMDIQSFKELPVEQNVDAILVVFKPSLNFSDLCYITKCAQVNKDAKLIAGNIDCSWKSNKSGNLPDTGSFIKAIEKQIKRNAITYCKPFHYAFNVIKKDHFNVEANSKKFIMIGDTFEQDMMFAYNSGIDSVLVLSGATKIEDLDQDKISKITYIMPSIGQGIEEII